MCKKKIGKDVNLNDNGFNIKKFTETTRRQLSVLNSNIDTDDVSNPLPCDLKI